ALQRARGPRLDRPAPAAERGSRLLLGELEQIAAGEDRAIALVERRQRGEQPPAPAERSACSAARRARPARRPAARRRLRASLATMASSQGRNGAPVRKRGSARQAFTKPSWAASSASAADPPARQATRKAMS